ncbi:hypothetical protein TWF481_004573 [Arthrobotrys musiformis]|uniref:Uncharacterized protein n=1 Tax=Arthrobotrys musiformis TaxID=47236 RepID=A0AAV9WLY3_9PEZI
MAWYSKHDVNQIWYCYESDGWLSFAHIATGRASPAYLGYRSWPSSATLQCNARAANFNEQFDARSRPGGGFQLLLRNGFGLEPVGWDGEKLSRVSRGGPDVWFRFTKVQDWNPGHEILLGVGFLEAAAAAAKKPDRRVF